MPFVDAFRLTDFASTDIVSLIEPIDEAEAETVVEENSKVASCFTREDAGTCRLLRPYVLAKL